MLLGNKKIKNKIEERILFVAACHKYFLKILTFQN